MSTAGSSLPFLHVVVSGDPPSGAGRPRATLMPLASFEACRARAASARSMRDLMALFRPKLHETHAASRWKRDAEKSLWVARQRALGARPVAGAGEAIEIFVLLVFELPASRWRKRAPLGRSWQVSHRAGDFDNLAKPLCDAANEVLWPDDCQVARACVEKVVGAQGEPARVELLARRLLASPEETLFAAVASGRGWSPVSAPVPSVVQEGLWRSNEEAETGPARARPPL